MSIENGAFKLSHSSGVLCLQIGGNLRYNYVTYIIGASLKKSFTGVMLRYNDFRRVSKIV